MMLLVDTKVDVKYKNGGVRMERVPKSVFTKEFNILLCLYEARWNSFPDH